MALELPEVNIEDFTKWAQKTAIIKESDMEQQMQIDARDFVTMGIEKSSGASGVNIEAACKFVKENMDRQFGPSWHCIMGEGFSFEVTRQSKATLYMFYGGNIAILLFKC